MLNNKERNQIIDKWLESMSEQPTNADRIRLAVEMINNHVEVLAFRGDIVPVAKTVDFLSGLSYLLTSDNEEVKQTLTILGD